MTIDKPAAEEILSRVQVAQTKFWDALNELEAAIGHDLDSVRDFAEMTLDDLLEEEEDDEHPDTDEHRAGCTHCMYVHDKNLPDPS